MFLNLNETEVSNLFVVQMPLSFWAKRRKKRSLEERTAENVKADVDTCTNEPLTTTTSKPHKRRRLNADDFKEEHAEPANIKDTVSNTLIQEKQKQLSNDPVSTHNAVTEPKEQSLNDFFGGKNPWKSGRSIKELKDFCRSKGLTVGGNKDVLINRLLMFGIKNMGQSTSGKCITEKQVHDMLRSIGVIDPDGVNPCLKRGIQRGYYVIDGVQSLCTVILKGQCYECNRTLKVTIGDAMYQSCYGGNDYEDGSEGGAIKCFGDLEDEQEQEDEPCSSQYITGLCKGKPSLDSGKFHNHCTECLGFGECIGECRRAH